MGTSVMWAEQVGTRQEDMGESSSQGPVRNWKVLVLCRFHLWVWDALVISVASGGPCKALQTGNGG